MGWSGVKNGELLKLVESRGFQVFLTGDKNLPKQQRLEDRPFAVVVLSAINWAVIRKYVPTISTAIDSAAPGTVSKVQVRRISSASRKETWRACQLMYDL